MSLELIILFLGIAVGLWFIMFGIKNKKQKNKKQKKKRKVWAGQVWCCETINENPFIEKETMYYEVLEVRESYVKYTYSSKVENLPMNSGVPNDFLTDTAKIDTFIFGKKLLKSERTVKLEKILK